MEEVYKSKRLITESGIYVLGNFWGFMNNIGKSTKNLCDPLRSCIYLEWEIAETGLEVSYYGRGKKIEIEITGNSKEKINEFEKILLEEELKAKELER